MQLTDQAVYWNREYEGLRMSTERKHHELIVGMSFAGASFAAVIFLVWGIVRIWKWVWPGVLKRIQLVILLVVAAWCSICAIVQALNEQTVRHPISAGITTLLLCTPALLFGGVAFWWFSPWKPRPGKVERLW